MQSTANVAGIYSPIQDYEINEVLRLAESYEGRVNDLGYLQLGIQFMANNCVDITKYLIIYECSIEEIHKLMKKSVPTSSVTKNFTFLTHFKPKPNDFQSVSLQANQNAPSIYILNMTVVEFNEKYKDQYHIKEDNSYASKGFWTVHNAEERECGVFSLFNTDNIIRETPLAKETLILQVICNRKVLILSNIYSKPGLSIVFKKKCSSPEYVNLIS